MDKLNDIIGVMVSDIEEGRPGKRIRTPDGNWITEHSTYPQWLGQNSLTRKEVVKAYNRYLETGEKLQAYQIMEELGQEFLEYGYDSPFYGHIPSEREMEENSMAIKLNTKDWKEIRKNLSEEKAKEIEEIEGNGNGKVKDLPPITKEEVEVKGNGNKILCEKCGAEIKNKKNMITFKKGEEETRYHLGCWVCLPKLKKFQITFTRPTEFGESPRTDVYLDSQVLVPGIETKKKILELCYLLEKEYQEEYKKTDC